MSTASTALIGLSLIVAPLASVALAQSGSIFSAMDTPALSAPADAPIETAALEPSN